MLENKIDKILFKIIFISSIALLIAPLLVISYSYFPYTFIKTVVVFWLIEIIFISYVILALRNKNFRPKFNALTVSLLILAVIYIITSITGLSFNRSFWGDWERFEGVYLFLHFIVWFVAISSILKKLDQWRTLFKVSLYVSLGVAFFAFLQAFDLGYIKPFSYIIPPALGGRVFSTIGNAAMLATYSLIHLFLGLYLWTSSQLKSRWLFFSIAVINLVTLLLTGTRGAVVALALSIIFYIFLAVKNKLYQQRSYKLLFVFSLIIVVLGIALVLCRNISLVRNNDYLIRFADFSFSSNTIKTRLSAWQYGLKGFKENFWLGVGPENYNVVFNKYINAELYANSGNEVWFSRAHNKFIDQAVMSGVFGLLAYLSIFIFLFLYLLKLFKKQRIDLHLYIFFFLLLLSYFIQNLFLFDNVNSYLLFFLVVAFINFLIIRKDNEENLTFIEEPRKFIFMPLIIGLVIIILFSIFNINFIRSNYYVFQGVLSFDRRNYPAFNENFQKGIELSVNPIQPTDVYAEKMADILTHIGAENLAQEEIIKNYDKLADYFAKVNKLDPDNVFNSFQETKSYIYLAEIEGGQEHYDKALELISKSHQLSPGNIRPYWQEFMIYDMLGDFEKGKEALTTAIELAPTAPDTYWLMAIVYFKNEENDKGFEYADKTIDLGYNFRLKNDIGILLPHYTELKDWDRVIKLMSNVIELDPKDIDAYLYLADVYIVKKDYNQAIYLLKKLIKVDPSLTDKVVSIINSIRKNNLNDYE
ncbi:O-antigen ligase family protein [Patescibacteria group bacterium]|nr:O-antigen ligase family protein [Patescibacteria group bacterium]